MSRHFVDEYYSKRCVYPTADLLNPQSNVLLTRYESIVITLFVVWPFCRSVGIGIDIVLRTVGHVLSRISHTKPIIIH